MFIFVFIFLLMKRVRFIEYFRIALRSWYRKQDRYLLYIHQHHPFTLVTTPMSYTFFYLGGTEIYNEKALKKRKNIVIEESLLLRFAMAEEESLRAAG